VTEIGWGAFKDCSGLTSVTIPKSVTYIGSEAFDDASIKSIIVRNPIPPILGGRVSGWDKTLYVPKGSHPAYRYAYGWKDFKRIREIRDWNAYVRIALCILAILLLHAVITVTIRKSRKSVEFAQDLEVFEKKADDVKEIV